MILISHRGNTSGSNSELENKPEYIMNTLQKGYDVEVDIWSVDKQFYLGHDEPQYKIERVFTKQTFMVLHKKNRKDTASYDR